MLKEIIKSPVLLTLLMVLAAMVITTICIIIEIKMRQSRLKKKSKVIDRDIRDQQKITWSNPIKKIDLNVWLIMLLAASVASCKPSATLHKTGSYTIAYKQGHTMKFKDVKGLYDVPCDTCRVGTSITINVIKRKY